MYFKFKKSISPLIATILLVVVAVAVIGIIVLWGKGFTTDNLSLASQTSKESSLCSFVWQDNLTGTNLILKNTHATKGETIVAYKINSFADYSFLNTEHTLDTPITLNESGYATITLGCLPEAKFSVDLITSNGDYINVPVVAKFFDATACTFSTSITSPENNSINAVDSEIIFTSSTTNNSETPSCSWDSNIDDVLSTSCDFNISDMNIGTHLITLDVNDSGDTQTQTITIVVKAGLVITIDTPLTNSGSLTGSEVSFTSSIDNNYGIYSCSWDSNRDGVGISTSCDFNISSLSVGTHLISLSVTDSLETMTTTKILTVKTNLVPVISSPSDGSTSSSGASINFIGTTDSNFGIYTCSWDSNLYSSFGSGCDIDISDLNVGAHLITLSITDDLETQSTTQNITVSNPELPYIMYNSAKLYIHPTNNSEGIKWGLSDILTSATSTTNGLSNTNTIVATYGASTSYAAGLCSALVDSYMGYDDWYLPATGQLTAMYTTGNSGVVKGTFAGSWVDFVGGYWSSTDVLSYAAYWILMSTGFIDYNAKSVTHDVRCVRDE